MIMLLKVAVFWFQMSREKKQAGYWILVVDRDPYFMVYEIIPT